MIPNIAISVSALPKSGKNHFAMSAPQPIRIYCFNGGADYVRAKFPSVEADVKNYPLPIIEDTDQVWAAPLWEEFTKQLKSDIAEGKFQTYVLDTSTEVENICQQDVLETAIEVSDKDKHKLATNEYLARNLKMKAIYDQIKNAGCNLIALQYLKEEWVRQAGEKMATATGKLVPDGWKRNESQCDINLEFVKRPVTDKGKRKLQVVATVVSSRFDDFENTIVGETLVNPTWEEVLALAGVAE